MNRFRVMSTVIMGILALSQFLLQPDNLIIWGNPRLAGVALGAIAVLAGVVSSTMPSWFQAPSAERAVRRAEAANEQPPRG
jgi:uncharacterized membrane protein YccC